MCGMMHFGSIYFAFSAAGGRRQAAEWATQKKQLLSHVRSHLLFSAVVSLFEMGLNEGWDGMG